MLLFNLYDIQLMSQLVVNLDSVPIVEHNLRLQVILQVTESSHETIELRSLVEKSQRLTLYIPDYIRNIFVKGDIIKVDCLYDGDWMNLNILDIISLQGDLTLLNNLQNLQILEQIGTL